MTFLHTTTTLFLLTTTTTPASASNIQRWSQVLVSPSLLTAKSTVQSTADPLPPEAMASRDKKIKYCSITCHRLSWCRVWCTDDPTAGCTFYDLIVMPAYQDPTPLTATECFTTRRFDFVTHATITSGQQNVWVPLGIKENIVDGIHSFGGDDNFVSTIDADAQWLVIDFGNTKKFTQVLMIAEASPNAAMSLQQVEIRIGNTTTTAAPPEGLQEYKLFGKFPGPATSNQEIMITSHKPVSARFVSFRKLDYQFIFAVGHIEVY
ncbi:hypothetical protein Pmani_019988 [Petrolisthes manimaculis]|uniref:F5/8 type C domain-containing protein n=1 Tax=Petrolisthes manimaculis TaxID=1843537 RepID=A0AAE1PIK0_9EUCA|nr:hypothetical protein Pmani_019988 [Petrolisthes manimaculis]